MTRESRFMKQVGSCLGTNNLEIADVILNWVDHSVPPRAKNGKDKKS